MILTLEVTGPQAQAIGAAGRKVFKASAAPLGACRTMTGCSPTRMCRAGMH